MIAARRGSERYCTVRGVVNAAVQVENSHAPATFLMVKTMVKVDQS